MSNIAEDVTVITPAIITRLDMLEKCIKSVNEQELRPIDHLIYLDHNRHGVMYAVNKLINSVTTTYTQFLSDDNYFYPQHIKKLLAKIKEANADVAYAYPDVVGRDISFDVPFSADELRKRNFISEPLCRTDALKDACGFLKNSPVEDWHMYLRMLGNGCKFVHVPEHTWCFVFGHGNFSTGDLK